MDRPIGPSATAASVAAQSGAGTGAESGAESESEAEAQTRKILSQLRDAPLSQSELALKIGLKTVTGAFNRSVYELLHQGLIERPIPEKPHSRLQK